jgi:hypothetical protein
MEARMPFFATAASLAAATGRSAVSRYSRAVI